MHAHGRVPAPFTVHVHRTRDDVALSLFGELDVAAGETAREALYSAVLEGPRILLVDLSELSFMASTGVHCLLDAGALAAECGVQVAVLRGSGASRRVLDLCNLEAVIPDAEDVSVFEMALEETA